MKLLSILKTGFLSLVYAVIPPAVALLVTDYFCKRGNCSGVPAFVFLYLLWSFSFVISIVILIVKYKEKTKMKQWQLFFIANGLIAFPLFSLFLYFQ